MGQVGVIVCEGKGEGYRGWVPGVLKFASPCLM